MVKKIVSGGQTGVDRAALDTAISLNIVHGGWCPKNRKAEDGTIHPKYNLKETETEDYSERTKLNIRDSDATIILLMTDLSEIRDGTILTAEEAHATGKSLLLVDIRKASAIEETASWINTQQISVLNIAGPRESQSPQIYNASESFLNKLYPKIIEKTPSPKL